MVLLFLLTRARACRPRQQLPSAGNSATLCMFVLDNVHCEANKQSAEALSGSKHVAGDIIIIKRNGLKASLFF
jgi:hypothetical protein